MIFYIRVTSHIGLAFVFIFSVLILIKGDCGRNGYNDDNERRVMPYNPELSYRMAVLSVVAYDRSHLQHCLDQYLPAAKFQLQTVFTKKTVISSKGSALDISRFRILCECWSLPFAELNARDNLLMNC